MRELDGYEKEDEGFNLAPPKPRTPGLESAKACFQKSRKPREVLEILGFLLNIEPWTGDIFRLSDFQSPNAGSDMLP